MYFDLLLDIYNHNKVADKKKQFLISVSHLQKKERKKWTPSGVLKICYTNFGKITHKKYIHVCSKGRSFSYVHQSPNILLYAWFGLKKILKVAIFLGKYVCVFFLICAHQRSEGS